MKKTIFLAAVIAAAGAVAVAVWPGQPRVASPLLPTADAPLATPPAVVVLEDGDRFTLTASAVKKNINGREVAMLAYNGSIPGPLIRVKQGSEVTITFTNRMEIATTMHSHGVRLDNQFDGVPDVTQPPIKPGESFTYRIKFPDAGLFWYHPHLREDYAQELGLYGNFLVSPADPGYWPTVNQEWVVFLDDVLLAGGRVAPFDAEKANHTLMGRFGNVMLVNGETSAQWRAQRGDIVRLYLTNAANARPFNVVIPGVRMKLVGGDNGKVERETWVDSVTLGPSERAIVEVLFAGSGTYPVQHQTPDKTYALGTVVVADEATEKSFAAAFTTPRVNPGVRQTMDAFRPDFERPPDRELKLALAMKSPMSMGGGNQHQMQGGMRMDNALMQMGEPEPIEWEDDMGMMNRNATVDTLEWKMIDPASGKFNLDILGWEFKRGEVVKVRIVNDANSLHPMQHPIHIHGQRFLVLATNGERNDNLGWKDTTLVKTGDTVDLLVEMANPGTWMAHCHIAEHLEAGMMMQFVVR